MVLYYARMSLSRLSSRQRRAVSLGAISLIVIAAAGVAYLHSTSPSQSRTARQPSNVQAVQGLANAFAYDFVTPSVGWAVAATMSPTKLSGPFWVFRTGDSGKHWQKQIAGQTTLVPDTIGTLQMLDKSNGFVVAGEPLKLYRTIDGGIHWRLLGLPTQDAVFPIFSSLRVGWIEATSASSPPTHLGPHLYATIDAGDSWTRLPDPPVDLAEVAFGTTSEVWAGAQGTAQPKLYTSEDGGHSWQTHQLPAPPSHTGLDTYSTQVVILPGGGLAVTIYYQSATYELTSFDGGTSWTYTNLPPGTHAGTGLGYGYQDSVHWWAVEGNALYKSSDAGQSWTRFADVIPSDLNFLRVFDARTAWARLSPALASGLTFTSDGGLHWTPANPPVATAG
jgi:photosystem II stability/assembly factor-like uncharacterized protein